jgi:hypothetical protein
MAFKMIMMLKRKKGMTPEAFRHAYETGHSRIGLRLFGHLWTEYRRNYVGPGTTFSAADGALPEHLAASASCPYDAISEMVFKDAAALEELRRIASIPENQKLLADDEKNLFDRDACWINIVDVIQEDLSHVPKK